MSKKHFSDRHSHAKQIPMSVQGNNKKFYYILFAFIIGSLIILTLMSVSIDVKGYYFSLHQELVNFLKGKLVYEIHIPFSLLTQKSGNKTVIYVLGGNQDDLRHRFKEASILYHQGLSKKILILSRPGITNYDSGLGRNLTNDEWAIMELGRFNVKKEDIAPVSVQASFLGTWIEAKYLPDIARKKGYSKLLLVTSAYHTNRTITVFSKFAPYSSIELYIYGAEDAPGFQDLLLEYMKMLLYKIFVLPVYGWKETKIPDIRESMHRPAISSVMHSA